MNLKAIYISLAAVALFYGCTKEADRAGCTDPFAVNYDPRAIVSDDQCIYNDDEQLIWVNGNFGGWNGNLLQRAFRPELCMGMMETLTGSRDTAETVTTLYLGTADGQQHKSYITVLNEQNGASFAEGSIRFDARKVAGHAAPAYMKLFICGKLPDNHTNCPQFMRSDYVEISTHSFTDTTFTEVNIPMREFDKITMGRVNVLAGFEFSAAPGSGIEINHLRWTVHPH